MFGPINKFAPIFTHVREENISKFSGLNLGFQHNFDKHILFFAISCLKNLI